MRAVAVLFFIGCVAFASAQSIGFDISSATCDGSSWVSSTQFSCFANAGASFTAIEGWDGGYGATTYFSYCANVANQTGLPVFVYIFMCPNCAGNNADALSNWLTNTINSGVYFDAVWIDVESCSGCWNDVGSNANFVAGLVNAAQNVGVSVGIYTSQYEWSTVVGSYTGLGNVPLWYAHYDGRASCSEFSGWGGWSSAYMKQFQDHSSLGCFSNVDMDVIC
eukprot:TRINITY_DN211_c0_g1_i1.p1 TRINITY_DN211_c0_g1~~TRINITY_DN211_c0_g1_i1.p1  ORF type:complete len:240 (+),score=105.92 TRINITY_DN211_c0_g1_i1:56-721(+)